MSQSNLEPAGKLTLIQRMSSWGALILMSSLFLVPVALYSIQPELVQWRAAAAVVKYERGEVAAGIEQMALAVEESNDQLLRLQLARWQKDQQLADDLIANCDVILQQARENGDQRLRYGSMAALAMYMKADGLILKGDKRQAMQSVLAMDDYFVDGEGRSAQRRNALAYYRALCEHQLGQAIEDIDSVIQEQGGGRLQYPVTLPGEVAMSAGMVSRYVGHQDEALRVIAARIEELERESGKLGRKMNWELYRLLREFLPLNEGLYRTANLARDKVDQFQNELVVLKSVKALLLDDLGREDEAMQLRNEVALLGLSCADILSTLPSEYEMPAILEVGAQLLDTRGFVEYGRGNYSRALRDLDLAVLAHEMLRLSMDTPIQNTTDMKAERQLRRDHRRSSAVLLYHRQLVHKALGNSRRAESDRTRVMDLGFEPGPQLF